LSDNISVADQIAPECATCDLLRKRLHDVEEAAENYILTITQTGALREEAHKKMVAALTSDFKTAILTSHDMTPAQRAHWLGEIEKNAASRPAPAAGGEG
jgi:hypothetical protein